MKAWLVREKGEFVATVIFAETRGKAKALAQHTDACEYVDFCNIEARRVPQMDKYYSVGKKEMDWFNANDRIALVKYCGFVCDYVTEEGCAFCSAKKYCDTYKDQIEESEGCR